MLDPRRLGGVVRVRVVSERVQDRMAPSRIAVRVTERAHEARRVVVRGGGADHVHVPAETMEPLPAGGEKLLVGTCPRLARPELR